MATLESLAIRQERAIERIEEILNGNGVAVSLPITHRNREELHAIQLEMIADALADLSEGTGNNGVLSEIKAIVSKSRYTKAELEAVLDAD